MYRGFTHRLSPAIFPFAQFRTHFFQDQRTELIQCHPADVRINDLQLALVPCQSAGLIVGLPCKPALGVLLKGSAVVLIHPAAVPFFHSLCFSMDILHNTAFGYLLRNVDGAALHPLLPSGAVPVADSDFEFSFSSLLDRSYPARLPSRSL